MIIAHAAASDLPGILALEASGFPPGQQWSEASWAAELSQPDRLVLVRRDLQDQIVAVASFAIAGELVDLLRVVVAPRYRRSGLGRSIIRAGLDWAKASGAERMLLEVRPDNTAALALYSQLGFHQLARRRDYYATGVDALVMEAAL